MKRPTLLPVALSEILNFWNFAVRHVYMPTNLSLSLSLSRINTSALMIAC